jgi:hypothetical protein
MSVRCFEEVDMGINIDGVSEWEVGFGTTGHDTAR